MIDKINPAGMRISTLGQLHGRYLDTAGRAAIDALGEMRQAWDAYRPLLEDLFEDDGSRQSPFPPHHFLNMLAAYAENPFLGQYLHGGVHDIVRAANEFLECAARFDAECCPDPGRFPKHVLLGDAVARPLAFDGAPKTVAEYQAYDAARAVGGPAPEGIPAARRHHFVPSLALDGGQDKLAELRALFYRLVLLAQSFATRDRMGGEIRLTPSRNGAAPLGERAIPFYYQFAPGGDLWRKLVLAQGERPSDGDRPSLRPVRAQAWTPVPAASGRG